MIHGRWLAALGAAAILSVAAGADAPAQTRSLIGKWSADQGCGAQSRQIVFRGTTMELWDGEQRLFVGNVRFANSGGETAVTTTGVGAGSPPRPGMPVAGDIAAFRRDGSHMFPVAVTHDGVRHNVAENVQPFYLCR